MTDARDTISWSAPLLVEISSQGRINSGKIDFVVEDADENSNPSGAF